MERYTKIYKSGALVVIFLLLLQVSLNAKTIVVPDLYPTITQAMRNAEPGDTVFVKKGKYKENVQLSDEVVLIGEDKFTTIIDGGRRGWVVRGADNSVIENFTITNGFGVGILCDNSAPIIRNNIIKENRGTGIMAVMSLPQIENNIIWGNEWTGIYLEAAKSLDTKIDHNVIVENGYHGIYCGDETGALITNNIIMSNKEFGVYVDKSSKKGTRLEYNNIYNNLIEVSKGFVVSVTNLREDPKFEDKKSFRISDFSPCKKAGENATDIGLMEGLQSKPVSVNTPTEGDSDGDGISDDMDKCPNIAEDKDGFQDNDGCPDNDNDNDGINDKNDMCPNEAEDIDGFQDNDGCPDFDNDGDGVLDKNDRCPNEVESFNGYKDYDGCPDEKPTKLPQKMILEGVNFESGSATLTPESYVVLDDVVNQLKEFNTTVIEIGGHTDNVGDPKKNMRLSLERAKAVKEYLVSKGISPKRIKVKGYGDKFPIADNSTEEGRAKNRRIEFKVIKQ